MFVGIAVVGTAAVGTAAASRYLYMPNIIIMHVMHVISAQYDRSEKNVLYIARAIFFHNTKTINGSLKSLRAQQ